MKLQDAFDISKAHLLRQSRASMSQNNPAYHGDNGHKCPAGIHIDASAIDSVIDRFDVRELIENHPAIRDMLMVDDVDHDIMVDFYLSMQIMHDNYLPSQWVEIMEGIATDFNLK